MSVTRLSALVRSGFRMVQFRCRRCPRFGRYRVSSLVEQWGAETSLAEIMDHLRQDCPMHAADSRSPYDICGINCPTLSELAGLTPRT